jgi:hypothetical protein
MGREQIAEEVKRKGIPLLVDMYPDIIELRRRYKQALESPDKFKEEEAVEIEKHKNIVDTVNLNKDVFDNIKLDAPNKLQQSESADIPMDSDQTKEDVNGGSSAPTGVTDEFPAPQPANLPKVMDVTNKKTKKKTKKRAKNNLTFSDL